MVLILSVEEEDVLKRLARDETYQEIADAHGISYNLFCRRSGMMRKRNGMRANPKDPKKEIPINMKTLVARYARKEKIRRRELRAVGG